MQRPKSPKKISTNILTENLVFFLRTDLGQLGLNIHPTNPFTISSTNQKKYRRRRRRWQMKVKKEKKHPWLSLLSSIHQPSSSSKKKQKISLSLYQSISSTTKIDWRPWLIRIFFLVGVFYSVFFFFLSYNGEYFRRGGRKIRLTGKCNRQSMTSLDWMVTEVWVIFQCTPPHTIKKVFSNFVNFIYQNLNKS